MYHVQLRARCCGDKALVMRPQWCQKVYNYIRIAAETPEGEEGRLQSIDTLDPYTCYSVLL